MSLPRYEEYRDSGAECLGAIPSHWEAHPCRYFVVEQTAKNENAENQAYLSLMANVGIIPYEEKGDVGNKKPEDLSKCKLVSKGDLVINSMNYGIGSYGLSDLSGVCSPVYIVLRPLLDRVKARFAFRIFENKAFQTYAQSFGNGILEHRAAINWDILKGIRVGLPPIEEQEAILCFLDRETAKIDALIAEQEKLIALLAEKRQATISHAVTKGLNPNAPMKDSGLAWLGEVPAHWLVRRLKQVVRPGVSISYGIVQPGEPQDEGVPFVQTSNMSDSSFALEQLQRTTFDVAAAYPRSRLSGGEVILGIRASIGAAHVVPQHLAGANLSRGIARIECGDDITPTFLVHVLRGSATLNYWGLSKQGSTFNEVSIETVRELAIAVPPLSEQKEINEFLDEEIAKVAELLSYSQTAVPLLIERRSALIAAAVTGQINVRNVPLR